MNGKCEKKERDRRNWEKTIPGIYTRLVGGVKDTSEAPDLGVAITLQEQRSTEDNDGCVWGLLIAAVLQELNLAAHRGVD